MTKDEGKEWYRHYYWKNKLKNVLGGEGSEFEQRLRKRGIRKMWDSSCGLNFTCPFDKNGNPRKYLKVLLALEVEPGLTKEEIYRDVLNYPLIGHKLGGQDSTSLWSPLAKEGLVISRYDPKTKKYRKYLGPTWPEYKDKILRQQ